MAVKTGVSHLLATLLLTLISALLIHFLRHVGFFESVFDYMLKLSLQFSDWLEKSMNISIAHEIFPTVFVAAILAFAWGIIFHISRK